MSMLRVHPHSAWPCPGCMFTSRVMSMSMRDVHVQAAFPHQFCMSKSILHVHVQAAAHPSPDCMSVSRLHVHTTNLHVQVYVHDHVQASCPSQGGKWMTKSILRVYVHAAYPCPGCISMSKSMLHVHVYAAYPYWCCMSNFMLRNVATKLGLPRFAKHKIRWNFFPISRNYAKFRETD